MRATHASARADARPGRRGRRGLLLGAWFVVAVLVFDGLAGERGTLALMRAREQRNQLAADVARARAENARLSQRVWRLANDPAAVEDLARRELGFIKPGERLFIIRDIAGPAAK